MRHKGHCALTSKISRARVPILADTFSLLVSALPAVEMYIELYTCALVEGWVEHTLSRQISAKD